MKHSTSQEMTVVIELERGEWTVRYDGWSIVQISFTVYKNRGLWSVRINHSDFRACKRRWDVKTRVVFSAPKVAPGFFPRLKDVPHDVLVTLVKAYAEREFFPDTMPAIESGEWNEA